MNIILAIALLVFVLFAGSTVVLLQAYVQNVGAYLGSLLQRTFRMYAYEPNAWFGDWTLFYRSEEHTSELQSLMRISYAVFCLKKKLYWFVRSIGAPVLCYHSVHC